MNRMTMVLTAFCLVVASGPAASNWPHWRGPNRNGLVDGSPPVQWSEQKNIRWKAPIPGLGHATPVVWGERIFVQTAVMTDKVAAPTGSGKAPTPAESVSVQGPGPGSADRRNHLGKDGPGGPASRGNAPDGVVCVPIGHYGRRKSLCVFWITRALLPRYGRQSEVGVRPGQILEQSRVRRGGLRR